MTRWNRRHWLFALAAVQTQSACSGNKRRPLPDLPDHVKGIEPAGIYVCGTGPDGDPAYGVEFYVEGQTYKVFQTIEVGGGRTISLDFPLRYIPRQFRVVWRTAARKPYPIPHLMATHYDDQGKWKEGYQAPDRGDPRTWSWQMHEQREIDDVERRKLIAKNMGFTHEGPWSSEYTGPLGGDFIVPVANKIPRVLMDELRARPGGLRLKFKLLPEGVLLGWDIMRTPGGLTEYFSAGGEFNETRRHPGLTPGAPPQGIQKGWYTDLKTGQRVEGD